jgi:hypothetical protein
MRTIGLVGCFFFELGVTTKNLVNMSKNKQTSKIRKEILESSVQTNEKLKTRAQKKVTMSCWFVVFLFLFWGF